MAGCACFEAVQLESVHLLVVVDVYLRQPNARADFRWDRLLVQPEKDEQICAVCWCARRLSSNEHTPRLAQCNAGDALGMRVLIITWSKCVARELCIFACVV